MIKSGGCVYSEQTVSLAEDVEIEATTTTVKNPVTDVVQESESNVKIQLGSLVFNIYDNLQYAFADAEEDVIITVDLEAYLIVGG